MHNLACFGKARSTFEKMRQVAGSVMPKDNFAAPPRRPFEEIIHEETYDMSKFSQASIRWRVSLRPRHCREPMAGRAERQATIRLTARRMRTLLAPTRRNSWESDKQTELVFCDDMGCHGSSVEIDRANDSRLLRGAIYAGNASATKGRRFLLYRLQGL
jgi:hypothetical protein